MKRNSVNIIVVGFVTVTCGVNCEMEDDIKGECYRTAGLVRCRLTHIHRHLQ